jgi:hypothetical protein
MTVEVDIKNGKTSCFSSGNMQVFYHHVYEYQKGLRDLILHTTVISDLEEIKKVLEGRNISYTIQHLKNGHMNVFFGSDICINVIMEIGKTSLVDYTPEEDFILGIMLGYDRKVQCRRFLDMNRRGGTKL